MIYFFFLQVNGELNSMIYIVINRGNPQVKTLYPYPYPPNTLPVPQGMSFVPPQVRVSDGYKGMIYPQVCLGGTQLSTYVLL
jgi:hypothetical protein